MVSVVDEYGKEVVHDYNYRHPEPGSQEYNEVDKGE